MASINNPLFFRSHQINSEQYWRLGCDVIEWCIEIKHNTHPTQSELWTQRNHTVLINSPPFKTIQQTTRLGTWGQRNWKKGWEQTQHSLNSICFVKTKQDTKWIHQRSFFPLTTKQQTTMLVAHERCSWWMSTTWSCVHTFCFFFSCDDCEHQFIDHLHRHLHFDLQISHTESKWKCTNAQVSTLFKKRKQSVSNIFQWIATHHWSVFSNLCNLIIFWFSCIKCWQRCLHLF